MKYSKVLSAAILFAICVACLAADLLTAHPPQQQYRNHLQKGPSREFWLGTDELGRDRLSRVLHGGRISLLLAPAAAAVSVVLALILASLGTAGGRLASAIVGAGADLTLTVPWMFLLLMLRAAIPLDASDATTLAATAAVLAVLGWAGPARVLQASIHSVLAAPHVLAAKARGVSGGRRLLRHVLPLVATLAMAQTTALIPLYLLAEANLGILGLGAAESVPTWGNLLRELGRTAAAGAGWEWMGLVPVLCLALVCTCLYALNPSEVSS